MKPHQRTNFFPFIAASLIIIFTASGLSADIIELDDGLAMEGTFVGGTRTSIRFEVDGHIQNFPLNGVFSIIIDPTIPRGTGQQAAAQPAPVPATATVTVPAGTMLLVRMVDAVDSSRHGVGHRFTALLEADLVASGQVVANRGSNVYGRLTDASQAGNVAGKSELTLELTGIMIDNQIRPVLTSEVQAVSSQGSGGSTARRTATGALVGGAFGGRKGARRGTAVGVGVSVLTSGASVNIPADTLLEYRLAQPFTP